MRTLAPMRVALVSPYSLSVPGGVQGQVLGLARALRRAGHEAVVVGPAEAPPEGTGLPGEAVVVVGRSLPFPANGSVARLAVGPVGAARTVRALRRLAPDVVHLHEPLAPGVTWAALARPGPKVGTFHRAGAVAGAGLLAPVARRLAGRLSARTAVSEAAAATARALVGGDYEIVGNGVELDGFAAARDPGQPVGAPVTGPVVLFVGRHERRKGLAVLLEAFAALGEGHGATLWVAGEGPQTAELRDRFPEGGAVEWLGRLTDEELAGRLGRAQVLCAPSLGGESFGVVLLEAMAAGAVVVASDIPGYAAVVDGHGVLVAPGDPAALAGALGSVLDQVRVGAGRASAAALEAARGHASQWSMDAVAARHVALYRRVLGQGGSTGRP